MNIMSVKEQLELIGSLIVSTGTTAVSFNIDKFMVTSTPYIKYIGMIGGVILTLILCVYWSIKIMSEKQKRRLKKDD